MGIRYAVHDHAGGDRDQLRGRAALGADQPQGGRERPRDRSGDRGLLPADRDPRAGGAERGGSVLRRIAERGASSPRGARVRGGRGKLGGAGGAPPIPPPAPPPPSWSGPPP